VNTASRLGNPQFAASIVAESPVRRAFAPRSSGRTARIGAVDLARLSWLLTVGACLIAVLILVIQGYIGYAGVTLAVAICAAVNLV